MKLHDLSFVKKSRFSRKRVGRGDGSGIGKNCGRGENGQNSRSGGGVRLGFEGGQMPLMRRLPKRGFFNPFSVRYQIVKLAELSVFENKTEVTLQALKDKFLIKSLSQPVKILDGAGDFSKSITLKVNACSKSVQKKIEELDGKVENIK